MPIPNEDIRRIREQSDHSSNEDEINRLNSEIQAEYTGTLRDIEGSILAYENSENQLNQKVIVDLYKPFINKIELKKAIDVEISELSFLSVQGKIDELFTLYDEVSSEVPPFGDNSHKYLIDSSIFFVPNSYVSRSDFNELSSSNAEALNRLDFLENQNNILTQISTSLSIENMNLSAQLADLNAQLVDVIGDTGPAVTPILENIETFVSDLSNRLGIIMNTLGPIESYLIPIKEEYDKTNESNNFSDITDIVGTVLDDFVIDGIKNELFEKINELFINIGPTLPREFPFSILPASNTRILSESAIIGLQFDIHEILYNLGFNPNFYSTFSVRFK